MAESIGGLFLKIGISLNELESDFIAAEKSVKENFARLSRENRIIKLRAEIETAGLDPAKNAAKILEVQMQSLNQQIANQQDRVKLTTAAWLDAKNKFGEASAQTQKLQVRVEEESAALAKLQAQLQNLNNQKINLGTEQINAQFSNMQRTIETHISKLNQQNTVIKLRTELDTAGLDKAKDASKIYETQIRSLNQQIKNQQAIVRATEKALRETVSHTGKFSSETMKATVSVEREKVALKNFEQELRSVSNAQSQFIAEQQKAASQSSSGGLLQGYQNIKGNVTGKLNELMTAFNGISTASQSADGAITKSLEIIDSIPTPVGKAVTALATLPLVLKGVENSILNMVKPVVEAGDATYVMSRGMQMSIADTGKLATICKVTGIEISEVNSTIRRLTTQYIKAGKEGNLLTKTLDRYGAKLTDVNGKLKDEIEISYELGDALKKAEAEGNGRNFRDAVFGKFVSGDFMTYLEDFRDNVEAASKIIKNGLANPILSHDIQGKWNAMDEQAKQMKAAFSSALLPVANEIIPKIMERMGEFTKIIAENKENIKFIGNVIAAPIKGINNLTGAIISLSDAIDEARKKAGFLGSTLNSVAKTRDEISELLEANTAAGIISLIPTIPNNFIQEQFKADLEALRAQKRAEELKQKLKERQLQESEKSSGLSAKDFESQEEYERAIKESNKRIKQNQRESSDILYKISHNEYDNKKHELSNWLQEQLNQENLTSKERLSLIKLAAAKEKEIEQERQQKINEIREEIASKNRTDLENQIAQIESTKERRIQAGFPAIEAEKAAEQEKYKAIKQLEEEFADARDAVHQTELEKRLAQIEKEKQAWIQKGIDEVEATELAEQQKAEIIKKVQEDFKTAMEALYQDDLEKELARIDAAKEAWIQKGIDEVEAAQWAEEAKAQAIDKNIQKEEAAARQRAKKRQKEIEEEKRAAIEKANAQRNAALQVLKSELEDYRLYQEKGIRGLIEKNKQELYKSGITDKDLQMTPRMLDDFKKAQHEAIQQLLPNFTKTPYESLLSKYDRKREPEEPSSSSRPQRRNNPQNSSDPNNYNNHTMFTPEMIQRERENGRNFSIDPTVEANGALQGRLEEFLEPFKNLGEGAKDAANNLSNLAPEVEKFKDDLSVIPKSETPSAPEIPEVNLPESSELNQNISNIVAGMENAQTLIQEATRKLNDSTAQIAELISTNKELESHISRVGTAIENQQPSITATNNITIEEAHAWDYNHIQELADRVADVILPSILRAIGGGRNAY